jgi:hypothetical protein
MRKIIMVAVVLILGGCLATGEDKPASNKPTDAEIAEMNRQLDEHEPIKNAAMTQLGACMRKTYDLLWAAEIYDVQIWRNKPVRDCRAEFNSYIATVAYETKLWLSTPGDEVDWVFVEAYRSKFLGQMHDVGEDRLIKQLAEANQ